MLENPSLFTENFVVEKKDWFEDINNFNRVSRFKCNSTTKMTELEIDIVTDLCPLSIGKEFNLEFTKTLEYKKTPSNCTHRVGYSEIQNIKMKKYDYIMYGKIFKIEDLKRSHVPKCQIYASFGGLLMLLSGVSGDLEKLELDQNIYLLLKLT